MVHENPALPRLMFSEVIFSGDDERRLKAEKTIRGYLAGIGGIAGLGQEEGRIRADLDPETVAVMFLGLILPTIVLSQFTGGAFDVDSYADRAWRVFAEAILGQSETSSS